MHWIIFCISSSGGSKAGGGGGEGEDGSDTPSAKQATTTRGGANNPEDNNDSNGGVRSEEHVSNKEIASVVAPDADQEANAESIDEAVQESPAKLAHKSADILGGVVSAVKSDNKLEPRKEGHPNGGGSVALATQGKTEVKQR